MNKTLLLILCDFLLLTLLSLVNWEKEESETESSTSEAAEQSVTAMAMMEQDLLDTLTSTLEEEKVAQSLLLEEAAKIESELESANKSVEEREASIQSLEENLQMASSREAALAEEKKNLTSEVTQAKESISDLGTRYESLEAKAKQTEAQARMLQEELEGRLAVIKEKEEALLKEKAEKKAAENRVQELNVKVQVVEEQKKMLLENVETLKQDVVAERAERKELQAQTTQMAEGITQLAERSQDLTEEFRSSQPINANTLFSEFKKNQIITTFQSDRFYRGQSLQEEERAVTILVTDGKDMYALSHLSSTPLGFNKNSLGFRQVHARLDREGARIRPSHLRFLALDPRIVATPISPQEATALGGEVYYTALEPFKFSEAVLIDEKGEYYGEVEFKLGANAPGYVRMQSKIFSRLFGDFAPSKGDLVFSKTGELLGLMVDNRYCALIGNLVSQETLPLGVRFENDEFRKVMRSLRFRYDKLPDELR